MAELKEGGHQIVHGMASDLLKTLYLGTMFKPGHISTARLVPDDWNIPGSFESRCCLELG